MDITIGHVLLLNRLRIEIPGDITEKAKILDLYYIPSRYPAGFPMGKPAGYLTEKQAKEAIDASDSIFRFCESHFSE